MEVPIKLISPCGVVVWAPHPVIVEEETISENYWVNLRRLND